MVDINACLILMAVIYNRKIQMMQKREAQWFWTEAGYSFLPFQQQESEFVDIEAHKLAALVGKEK